MNLDNIPPDLLMARGEYATVRSAHEDEKKRMSVLCGSIAATAAQILRAAQPDNDAAPSMEDIDALILAARGGLEMVERCAQEIVELAAQRVDLKGKAWPRTPR